MPYNGSGQFTPKSPDNPVANGQNIDPTKFNNTVNDIATGLSTAIAKDGQTAATANLPMGGFKHTGVANATSSGQYAAYGQDVIFNNLTANMTGNFSGVGNISGNLSGNFTGNITGNFSGNLTTAYAVTQSPLTANTSVANTLYVDTAVNTSVSNIRQIQPITANATANNLTIGLNPTALDFRSPTLTTGVPNNRVINSTLSLVVPYGATLGTTNATVSRLAELAIDNSGTVELAIVNLAGGFNLDETTLINTTSINSSANSSTVVYSANARTNVPFRVTGFADVNSSVAGNWTTPIAVQGVGGEAGTALSSIGYSQTIKDMTASRTSGVTYINDSGRPILLMLSGGDNPSQGWNLSVTIAGKTLVSAFGAGSIPTACPTFIVPPWASYVVTWNSLARMTFFELR